jgi:hypothetical protein
MIELFSVYSVEIIGILSNILGLFFMLKAWRLYKEIDERDEIIDDYRKKITEYEKRDFIYRCTDELFVSDKYEVRIKKRG